MPNWNDPAVSRERVSLAAAAANHSWDWLVELRRQLKVDFQLLDERQTALLPPTSTDPDGLAHLLASQPPALARALTTALQTDVPQAVTIGSIQIVCRGVAVQRRIGGVLVLARTAAEGPAATAAARARLEMMATLLVGSIQAHLQSPPITTAAALQHVIPLWRLLTGVADRESDREVMAAFAEAMAVWHDIEMVGYVRTARGTFRRDVAVAGRVGTDRPISLPDGVAPAPLTLKRLPHAEVDAAASPFAEDPLFTLLRGGDRVGAWLVILSGAVDACDRDLLHAYLATLDLAVSAAASAAKARAQSVLAGQLWRSGPEAPREAAATALRELLELTESRAAVLTATAPGTPVWQVDQSRPGVVGQPPSAQLVVTGDDQPPMVTLTLTRDDGGQFTYANSQAAEASALLMQAWIRESLTPDALKGAREPFDPTLERRATEALERANTATVAVLTFGSSDGRTFTTPESLDLVAGQLRELDAIGVLSDGQVGLLLVQTTAQKAAGIIPRLERALSERADTEVRVTSAGFATREPGDEAPGPLLPEARRNALQRRAVDADRRKNLSS